MAAYADSTDRSRLNVGAVVNDGGTFGVLPLDELDFAVEVLHPASAIDRKVIAVRANDAFSLVCMMGPRVRRWFRRSLIGVDEDGGAA